MADSEAAELLREAQQILIEAMKTGNLGEKEAEIDLMQEQLESYAIELEREIEEPAD